MTEIQLKKLAQEVTGRNDPTEALWETLRSYIEHRIQHYRKEINRLESKYGLKYEGFAGKLNNEIDLSWEHEQDYMAWEEALTNLKHFEDITNQMKIHA